MKKQFYGILALGKSKQEAAQSYINIATGSMIMAVSSSNVYAIAESSVLVDPENTNQRLVADTTIKPKGFASLSGNDALNAKLTVCLDGCGQFIVSDKDLSSCPSCSASFDHVTDARILDAMSDPVDIPESSGGYIATASTVEEAIADFKAGTVVSCSSEHSTFGSAKDSNFDPYTGLHVVRRKVQSASAASVTDKVQPNVFFCQDECEKGVTAASDTDVVFCSHCGSPLVESGGIEEMTLKVGSISSKIVISGKTAAAAVESFRKTATGERAQILTNRSQDDIGSFSSNRTARYSPFSGNKVEETLLDSVSFSAGKGSDFDKFEAHAFECLSGCTHPFVISTSADVCFCPTCNGALHSADESHFVGLAGAEFADDADLDDDLSDIDDSDLEDDDEDPIESASEDEDEDLDLDEDSDEDSDEDLDLDDDSDEDDLESDSSDEEDEFAEDYDEEIESDSGDDESEEEEPEDDESDDESEDDADLDLDDDSEDEDEVESESGDDSDEEEEPEDEDSDEDSDDDIDLSDEDEDEDESDSSEAGVESVSMLEALSSSLGELDPKLISLAFTQGLEPRWHLFYDGTPVGYSTLTSLASVTNEANARKLFASPDFAAAVSVSCKEHGIEEAIKNFGIQSHVIDMHVGSVLTRKYAAESNSRVAAVREELETIKDDLTERYSAALSTAAAGINKQFFAGVRNGVIESLVVSLNAAGVANPRPLIAKAFRENGNDLFKAIQDKAEYLMSQSSATQNEIAEAIHAMDDAFVGTVTNFGNPVEPVTSVSSTQSNAGQIPFAERLAMYQQKRG